jgi:thioredoxin-like negative regulator of GroEL
VEAFLAQVLQRRGNHETFSIYRVDVEAEPDLASRFGVKNVPALAVVEGKRVKSKLESPEGCRDIEQFLTPWLK